MMVFCKILRPMKIFRLRAASRAYSSLNSSSSDTSHVEQLHKRGLLRISGEETSIFLQGLVTNDMRHLEEGASSMYTMFLNTKGRVLYDAILYRTSEDNVLYIESDTEALPSLQKHLKIFRVRRKIDVDIVNDFKLWVIFDFVKDIENLDGDINNETLPKGQIVSNGGTMPDKKSKMNCYIQTLSDKGGYIVSRDPRLSALGHRILAPADQDIQVVTGLVKSDGVDLNYRMFRYMLGIGEGIDDLPPGKCFPLEANCDYLHGVSFHKGCYIGQELTARTHHTGVVRKRLMPLFFGSEPSGEFKSDTPVYATPDSNNGIGKLRGVEKDVGLALLRVTEALQVPALRILDATAQAKRPTWWPQEAPKERSIVAKES